MYVDPQMTTITSRTCSSNMAKGAKGRRNSQKKKKSSKGTDEGETENGDEGVKKCPHIAKAVKLHNLQNKIPHTTLGQCLKCGELDSSEGLGVCICLCCAHQGCDRNSEEKHSLSHNESNTSHNIVVHLQNWVVWCYGCDDEVPVEPESTIHNCIKLILKAMNLSPPPGLEASLSSPNKTTSDKPKKDDSKNNSQLRSQIKGLSNLGNTCFFNSVMQNLCQTELLHIAASCTAQEGFSQHVSPSKKDLPRLTVTVQEAPGSVTKALWKLLQETKSSSDRTLNPRQLFGEICKTATRFKGFRQQDSQELLRYLFDSIRNEELRRVKVAVLKSFGVAGGADAKHLDENKRAQVKEYGASAEAPLIDSVFAGRLVSIVTCHQCHQEFKVEETFLDLSLPLASPPQETFNNKFFAKGGKQSPKSPKTPNNESKNIRDDDKETEKDSKGKNLSKHQLKSARKAERKKGKKGKGHGKKGKSSQEAIDNKGEDNEEAKEDSGEEGDELDQMNVSDLDGSDNEQDHELNERVGGLDINNETEATVNSSGDSEVTSNNEVQLEGVGSNSQHSNASEKDCDTTILDSNKVEYLDGNAYNRACTERTETVDDSSKHSGENQAMENERATNNLQTQSTGCQQKGTNVTCEANSREYQQKLLAVENSNSVKETHEDEMVEQGSNTVHCVDGSDLLSPTESSDCMVENDDQCSQNERDAKPANDGTRSVLSSINEIVEEIVTLALDTSFENANECYEDALDVSSSASVNLSDTFTSACTENSLKDSTAQEEAKGALENGKETFASTEGLPLDKPENLQTGGETFGPTEGLPPANFNTVSVASSENISLTNTAATGRVENDKNCSPTKQETNAEGNEESCSDSTTENETETGMELAKSGETFDECETDSEEENETDCRSRFRTLQPGYHPSPGECSVMSCLSQFCASEMLDGNNKFACEECSKRAQQVQMGKTSKTAKNDDKDDDSDDSSSEDEPKGAKAGKTSTNKNKDSKHQTVYTIASKQLLISLAPPVLTLHLKRFQQARFTLRKLTKHVDFPLELNLAPFCSRSGKTRPDSEGQVLYSLYGIIQHSGNMNSGHYTACVKVREPPAKGLFDKITNMSQLTEFIKNMWTAGKTEAKHRNSKCRHEPAPSGQWFHVSDSSVVAVAEAKVLKSQAYMLFYGRLPLGSR